MKQYLLPLFLSLSAAAMAQVKGDEDKDMFNNLRPRDKQAADSARNGWWKASMKAHDARVQWWQDARFGMFIHWGIYSLPGGEWKGKKVSGYAEHLMRKERIPRAEYLTLAHQFNPVHFNADEWARHAHDAGMKYMIITSKHHDGFAMFDSQVSDFNIVQQTPFHRDPMVELSAACKKYGIKFGFYYSHAFDWEHPDAPGNDWEYRNPGGDSGLYGGVNWFDLHPELLPKAQRYVNEKAIPQIQELLRKYHPDILWFDTPSKLPLSENLRILEAIREVDDHVVVNGRLARVAGFNFGDYQNTADRPAEFFPVTGNWEAIPTTNESYGYSKFDSSHKAPGFFIQLMANAASRGGNLLMNIGPRGDGRFDERDVHILESIGAWMKINGASIYQTEKGPLPWQSWGVSTLKGNTLYLHVLQWPANGHLQVGALDNAGKTYFLADPTQKALPVQQKNGYAVIDVPGKAPDSSNTVIVVELKKPVQTDGIRYVFSNIAQSRLLAFDATLQGGGFSYADGKANHYYIEGWKSPAQSVHWTFKTISPATYAVRVKYMADAQCSGTYQLQLDQLQYNGAIKSGSQKGQQQQDAGTIRLQPGTHELTIQPVQITGKELMKLLEVQLVPVKE